MARLRAADWIFAGPGSPSLRASYMGGQRRTRRARRDVARRRRRRSSRRRQRSRSVLVTVPVYEIYKVGETPRWLDGPRRLRPRHRPARRDRAALEQRRGRHPRHSLLLPRRAPAARARSVTARRHVRARHRRAHRAVIDLDSGARTSSAAVASQCGSRARMVSTGGDRPAAGRSPSTERSARHHRVALQQWSDRDAATASRSSWH